MRYDVMRVMCFFDLPTETATEKRAYRQFRKNLISNGFEMLQYSVYVRIMLKSIIVLYKVVHQNLGILDY